MNANTCLRELISRTKVPRTTLAHKLGYKSRSGLSASITPRREDALCSRLVRVLDAMGYDLVARSRDGLREIVIDE